jgi:hypothetical protein
LFPFPPSICLSVPCFYSYPSVLLPSISYSLSLLKYSSHRGCELGSYMSNHWNVSKSYVCCRSFRGTCIRFVTCFFYAKIMLTYQIYFNVVHMGKKWHAYKVLVGKPEGKRWLGNPDIHGRIILKTILEK